jgi:hypothetical protein
LVSNNNDNDQRQSMPQLSNNSPQLVRGHNDAFIGAAGPSRGNTRPTTPFNPSFSMPGTPPELFLVTRDTPNISQDLWQNFQPDQLFPADSNIAFPSFSPHHQSTALVDPQLHQHSSSAQPPQTMAPADATLLQHHQNDPNVWANQLGSMNNNNAGPAGSVNDDTWSNSSKGNGPIVPTTLNVEDW